MDDEALQAQRTRSGGPCSAMRTSMGDCRRRPCFHRVPGLHHLAGVGRLDPEGRCTTRDRSLLVLAMTAALGRMDEFKLHAGTAPRTGVTDAELDELLFQIAAYCGAPAGVSARRRPRARTDARDGDEGDRRIRRARQHGERPRGQPRRDGPRALRPRRRRAHVARSGATSSWTSVATSTPCRSWCSASPTAPPPCQSWPSAGRAAERLPAWSTPPPSGVAPPQTIGAPSPTPGSPTWTRPCREVSPAPGLARSR